MRDFTKKVAALFHGVPPPSPEDIEEAFHFIRAFIRDRLNDARRNAERKALAQFSSGDLVAVKMKHGSRRLPGGAVGRIKRFNSKTLTVDFGDWREWRIPASFVEPAPKGARVSKMEKMSKMERRLFGGSPTPAELERGEEAANRAEAEGS